MQFSHRLYYWLKPVLPWRARMAARRIVARRERAANRDCWPIKESAGRKPSDWAGWPEDKKFAVVLTHDVETAEGLAQVRQLAELEIELGFRSSFNFIPKGAYSVPRELRTWLTDRGFEVGVHDLQHDGRLFQSKRGFTRKAVQINHHLQDWRSAGFRSGFMLRNLEWLHQLDIEYDASTFDTDPFELQSDGADTIFPYWIPALDHIEGGSKAPGDGQGSKGPFLPRRVKRGYVELPYTLPQDSTLFLVLGESTPEIWLRKSDWIAAKEGMVLVNVHPDYIDFSGRNKQAKKYPSSHYADLLRHISREYANEFWHPLPRELAGWYKRTRDTVEITRTDHTLPLAERYPQVRRKRAAVLLYSEYPADPRPRRAAEAMIEAGMEVDLLCVAGSDEELSREDVAGVRVTRLPFKRSRGSKIGYFGKYSRFIWFSFWFLARRGFWRKYDIIHVHNMPDVLVFSTALAKLRGASVILDLHDPMPEVMMTIYGLDEHRFPIRLLRLMEKLSIGFSDAVIAVNEACRKLFSARSCAIEKITVIMNSPDETVFRPPGASHLPAVLPAGLKPFVIMYHGSIVERHGLDIAVSALERFRGHVPAAELRIYGTETPFLQKVLASIQDPGLRTAVKYLGPKTLEQIVDAIRECDIGVIPNRRSIFTELNTPTRIFEYLSQARPVIAPRAPGILDYFGPDDLFYFELGDVDDLVRQLTLAYEQPDVVREIVQRGERVYRTHLWSNEKHRFMDVVAQAFGLTAPRMVEVPAEKLVPAEVGK